jgi:hypothetical protein
MFNLGCASKSHSSCEAEDMVFGSNKVKVSYYSPKNSLGLILIMPPTGGSNFLDRQYASSLCRSGFEALIVEGWQGLGEKSLSLEIHQQLLSRGQEAIDTVLKNFSAPFMGIVGTSVGALHSATALGRHDELKAGFLIAGGGPIHEVIATSDESTLKEYRKKRKEKFGFESIEEYSQALDANIDDDLDALNFQKAISQKRLALVVANKDETVKTEHQKNWVKAFNPEPLYDFDSSHFWSIVKTWWFHEDKISEFFLEQVK